jgi:hypothetical protein
METGCISYQVAVEQVIIRIVGGVANRPYGRRDHKARITSMTATWYQRFFGEQAIGQDTDWG